MDRLAEDDHDDGQRDQGQERQPRQPGADVIMYGSTSRCGRWCPRSTCAPSRDHAYGEQVVGRPGHDITGWHPVVERGGKDLEVLEEPVTQVGFDPRLTPLSSSRMP
jgi:hypothetical protein